MNLKAYRQSAKAQYPSVCKVDIDRIIAHVTGVPFLELFLHNERDITVAECAVMDNFVRRRVKKEPLQYIFEEAPFRDFFFKVGKGVLIPRPETEMLVDLALELMSDNSEKRGGFTRVCDLGTGSGAIAISIAMAKPDFKVVALDVSEKALAYARDNIDKYSVKNITLLHSNLFDSVKEQKFHLIIANLPYVSKTLYDNIDCEVRNFEPKLALLSGDDGLDLIRKVAASASAFLETGGQIIFEFSPEQKNEIIEILKKNNYSKIEIVNDLTNRARFALATS